MNTINATTASSIPPTIEFELEKFYGRTMEHYNKRSFDAAFIYFQSITRTTLRDQDAIQMLLERLPPEFANKIEEDAKAAELLEQHRNIPIEMTDTTPKLVDAKTLIDYQLVVNSIVRLASEYTHTETHFNSKWCSTSVRQCSYWVIITEVLADNKFKGYAVENGELHEFSLAQVHGIFEDYDPEEEDVAAGAKVQKFEVLFRTATNHRRKVKSTVWRTATTEIFCQTPAQALALAKEELDASDYEFEKENEEVYDEDEWDFETMLQDIEVSLNDEVVESVEGLDTFLHG